MINITRRALGVLVIKPAKGGAQLTVNAAGNPAHIKVRLDMARQGPPGPPGPPGLGGGGGGGGGLFRQVLFQALAPGAQSIPLGVVPVLGGFMQVFINGVLHLDASDYSVTGSILTLTVGVGVYNGDHILVVFQ